MKFKTVCQDHQTGENAVKCLSQEHNRMARVGLKLNHVDHNHGPLTTRICCRQIDTFKQGVESNPNRSFINRFYTIFSEP